MMSYWWLVLPSVATCFVATSPRCCGVKREVRTRYFLREFEASDVTLAGFVGSVGVMEVSDDGNERDPFAPRRTKKETSTTVRVFLARLNDPQAVSRGEDVRVSLREYSSGRVAENEIKAHAQLPSDAPVVTLIGTMNAEEFEKDELVEAWVANLRVDPPKKGSTWLVFKWAGSRTAASLPEDPPGFFQKKPSWEKRMKLTMRQSLEALAALHDASIAHRSIGLSSIVLDSKQQDKTAQDLALQQVRLDFLGFSTPATIDAIKEDLNAMGYAFFELVFSKSLNDNVPDQDALKRFYDDIFEKDLDKFRKYATDEPDWAPAVEFLDANDRAGWQLLDKMLSSSSSSSSDLLSIVTARGLLSSSPFFSSA